MHTIPDGLVPDLDRISDARTYDDIDRHAFMATYYLVGYREDTLPLLELIHARAAARHLELRDNNAALLAVLRERVAS